MPDVTTPSLGAWPTSSGTMFRVWAPDARTMDVVFTDAVHPTLALQRDDEGYWEGLAAPLTQYTRYAYRLEDGRVLPDPASRYQPDGVHGPSAVIDPTEFRWTDACWRTTPHRDLIIYELHVGTFSGSGRFADVSMRLETLAELGITAIELMPIAAFPGQHGWGYDGVDLFAPHAAYGTPDDLRALVDMAHGLGLSVLLDVVYNHLGPDGAYLSAYAPEYFHPSHRTPWGAALNLDGPRSGPVRDFLIANALHWVTEYHIDGLRLDATHTLVDTGPRHLLADLRDRVRRVHPGTILIAEDERRHAQIIAPVAEGGWGFDAFWADEFHHELRRLVAGDREGYFARYGGTAAGIARTIAQGWITRVGDERTVEVADPGAPADAVARRPSVICLQNHDQIGNRALGTRLNHDVHAAVFRAASVLLICAPQTPLLFMGQEWAASTPFLYFTDHGRDLGAAVTAGRRQEFAAFASFRDPATRQLIPDPQDPQTFERSRLRWNERAIEPHASTLRLYGALLSLRRGEPALADEDGKFAIWSLDPDAVVLRRTASGDNVLLIVVRLRGRGPVVLDAGTDRAPLRSGERWTMRLSTEDAAFADDAQPPQVEMRDEGMRIDFARAAGIVFARVAD